MMYRDLKRLPQNFLLSFILISLAMILIPTDSALAESIEWKTLPSESCRGLWLVPVTFDGNPNKTLKMVLDTGASHTVVDPQAIRRVFGRKVRAGKKVRLKKLEAGPLKIRSIRVVTNPLGHLARALGSDMDGILGFDVFKNLLLKLDYARGEIQVAKGSLPAVDDRHVFRDVGNRRPFLEFEVGGERVPVLADSGSVDGLRLRNADPIEWETPPRPLSAAVRYQSIELESTGRAAETYPFGPLVLERPIVEVADTGSRLAGWKIMRHFEWIFDPQNRRIQMTPNTDKPIVLGPLRGTGFAFRPQEKGLEVVHIFPNTPNEASEVRVGDVITTIDGVPVYQRGCRSIHDTQGVSQILLTVERQDEQAEIAVKVTVLVP